MSDDEPDPIVTRSITIAELMDGDGLRWISIDTEGDPEPWDVLGMLDYTAAWYRMDIGAAIEAEDD